MLVYQKSISAFAKSQAGGKGFNLYRLSKAGVPVPPWFVIGRDYFQAFVNRTEIAPGLTSILNAYRTGLQNEVQTELQIQELFMSQALSELLEGEISLALESEKIIGKVSVRSSAADEDSLTHSFAGQLSSFLYLESLSDIAQHIKHCWASGFSARSLAYRRENGLDINKIQVAVVVQQMIDPEKSGVLFTCDPVKKSLEHFVVSSVYGVGEGLVGGQMDADSFWLNSHDGTLMDSAIVTKTEKLCGDTHFGTTKVAVPLQLQNQPSLSQTELKLLFGWARLIHDQWNRPQDIEWAIFKGQVYFLQTRPVTNLDSQLEGYPHLWDNSNIVESYGGLTSPLSFSFALRNYRAVYIQFCEVLGVPASVIKDMESYLGFMLGHIRGRVFYNLFNWYKLVGVLPGFNNNREFMETMMGVSQALSPEIATRIQPHPSWNTPLGRWRKFVTGINFFIYHLRIQTIVDDFLKQFHRDYDHYRRLPLTFQRGDQLLQVYLEIESKMFGQWKAPIINDFLCMVHFGLLRKLTGNWLASLDSSIQNDLMAGEGGMESAEPTLAALRLAYLAQSDAELEAFILASENHLLLEALNQSRFQKFYHEVLNYLDRYGFRCMSEMKLEEVDLLSDPSYLFVVLKNYLKKGKVELRNDNHERAIRAKAEGQVRLHLGFLKQRVFFWVLKHARKAVKNRENTRFARTRIYGIARTIFRNLGEDLAAQGIIDTPTDIFWLTVEEVIGIYNGTLSSPELKIFSQTRKNSFAQFADEPDSRFLTRGPVYFKNAFNKLDSENSIIPNDADADLQGLPCCPGIIEGIVKVVLNPQDNLELNGEILVTVRTDPGWVPLYPSISGLLVERGSLLSHSAIVAREMGIPAIVSIPQLTKTLKTGMRVRLDGKKGPMKILDVQ
jgi:pyruvate,water dikinase